MLLNYPVKRKYGKTSHCYHCMMNKYFHFSVQNVHLSPAHKHVWPTLIFQPTWYITNHQGQLSFHPSKVAKSSTGLLVGVKAEQVHLCWVAGNAMRSHMTCITQLLDGFPWQLFIFICLLIYYIETNVFKRLSTCLSWSSLSCLSFWAFLSALTAADRHTATAMIAHTDYVLYYRVTTCLENLEMSGNLEHVREMSGMLLTVRELSGKKSCHGKVIYLVIHLLK